VGKWGVPFSTKATLGWVGAHFLARAIIGHKALQIVESGECSCPPGRLLICSREAQQDADGCTAPLAVPEGAAVNLDLDQRDIEAIAAAVAARLEGAQERSWFTRTEAAEHLRCSVRHLDKLVRLGEIPAYRPSGPAGRPLFSRQELDELVRE